MKNLTLITLAMSISFPCFAQEIKLVCDVKTVLQTSGVGVREEEKRVLLQVNTQTGVIEGGIAGYLSRLDSFFPKVSNETFSAVGQGRVDKRGDVSVPLATYELNRLTSLYKASLTLIALGRVQQQEESGQCVPADRKF